MAMPPLCVEVLSPGNKRKDINEKVEAYLQAGVEEVILVEAGQVWVELDKVRLTAVPGQSVIIPPHTPHAWGTTGPGTARVLFIWPVLEPFAPGKSTYLEGAPPAVS